MIGKKNKKLEKYTAYYLQYYSYKAHTKWTESSKAETKIREFKVSIGNSSRLKEVIRISQISSKSSSNVLILGESGTGKEMFAQALHYEGLRRKEPFVIINSCAIPRELAESEFFGYEPGAFTGADKRGRPGKFELAIGGTIFIDEIGELYGIIKKSLT